MASAYNPKKQPEQEPQESNPVEQRRCKAKGEPCPMTGSRHAGGKWVCTYHEMAPAYLADEVTNILKNNKRWFDILNAVSRINADEFDSLQANQSWSLDEILIPVKNETHGHWVGRVKSMIHRAVKSEIAKMIDAKSVTTYSTKSPAAARSVVTALTNGSLRKPISKAKAQQLAELNRKQEAA